MNKTAFSLLLITTSIFAGSRDADLKIILEKTYLSSQAEPILNMVATQAMEELGATADPQKVVEEFRNLFHEEQMQIAFAKPYEDLFSDEEVHELRIIHENPVWQKYAQQGTAIFSANLMTMKGVFKDLTNKFVSSSAILADIWQLSESNIEQLAASDKPVIVDVNAAWCSACRTMAPVFDEVSQEYQDQIQFAKMDIDAEHRLAKKFGIKGLPTLLFFKAGQTKPSMKHTGALTKEEFEAKIDQFLQRAK